MKHCLLSLGFHRMLRLFRWNRLLSVSRRPVAPFSSTSTSADDNDKPEETEEQRRDRREKYQREHGQLLPHARSSGFPRSRIMLARVGGGFSCFPPTLLFPPQNNTYIGCSTSYVHDPTLWSAVSTRRWEAIFFQPQAPIAGYVCASRSAKKENVSLNMIVGVFTTLMVLCQFYFCQI